MNRLESQKIPKHWNTQFQYMKRTFSSGETHSFIQWNAQFQVLKLCWNSYSKNHTYAYDNLNRLIKANDKAKSASYEMTMTFGRMSEPLTKVQKVDSTKTAQSYDFTYKYEDSNHPTAPTQIGHEHYTYDTNGNPTLVEDDSLNTERRMYWDEDNRLMVLSDNGKTSRYTYNAAGERIIKSHGDLEGVYINGAPQGITFHETEDYTIYPAPIITVTKNRFTKHYFIGDKRMASKLGTGKFSNVYGISGNNVTAGQKDYAARMMQIEKQREEYYKSLGTPPGVPTMKGATADPDNTGYGYNTIIGELGDHSVPEGWIQRPKFNEKGDVPGPPIQWQKPEDPDNAQPGYGYIPTDTTNVEDIFFYHSDHLGSTSYITDAKANITQFDAYLPYGELLVDEHSSTEDMPYKFNGKELDQETGLYYYGARYLNPIASIWYGVDPLTEKYPDIGGYVYCIGNPINLMDIDGREIFLHGSEDAQNAYVKMLYESTGNKYAIENNKLTFICTDTNFEGKKSQTLIKTIQSGIDAKETYNLNLVGGNSDDYSVFIDSYESKNIDISDLKVLGEASIALRGAVIGHFLNEVQVGGEFSTAHEASLKIEGLIFGELVGDNTIKTRKEYQLAAPKDGFQTIIFEYNSANKFKLEQGATSTTKGTGKFIGHVEITEITALSTGELKSANKIE